MRPLWFEFPDQPALYGVEEEFLLGPGILVKPVLQVRGCATAETLLSTVVFWYRVVCKSGGN